MASRSPNDLHPDILPKFHAFLRACQEQAIDVLVTCTYRSNAEQAKLYAQGRTAPGKIVTDAKPGESKHNNVSANGSPAAKAFDVVPMVNGKPDWDATDPIWERLGEIGERCGLEWAGRWTHFKEYPHFQVN